MTKCPNGKAHCDMEYVDGNGIDWETWSCTQCNRAFEVPIEIVRNFDEAVELEDDDASC